MSYNGIEINEFPLLSYTIFHTILLLAIIAIGIVGFFAFYDKDGKKAKIAYQEECAKMMEKYK